MYWPIPIIDTIKQIYSPSTESNPPSNDLVYTKLKKIDTALFTYESKITESTAFSLFYIQKYSVLKLEYDQKVLAIEKVLTEQNLLYDNCVKIIEAANQHLFSHLVQVSSRVEALEERPDVRKQSETTITLFYSPIADRYRRIRHQSL